MYQQNSEAIKRAENSKSDTMTLVEIATDLSTNETNIKVTQPEFEKIAILTKGDFYIWVGSWVTYNQFFTSNSIADLF